MKRKLLAAAAVSSAALLLAACSSTGASTTTVASSTTTTTAPTTTTSTTTTTTLATTTTSAAARNVVVTAAVRQSLLDAGAAYHQLPASDYTGLTAGKTYYAFDPATNTYYAAAGLMASSSSVQAQVGDQDDGAYNLFTMVAGASAWKVYNDGLGGAQGSTCPITIPAGVLAVWKWKPNSCYPSP